MLIGVISDTHIPERALKIPETVFKAFEDVDSNFPCRGLGFNGCSS